MESCPNPMPFYQNCQPNQNCKPFFYNIIGVYENENLELNQLFKIILVELLRFFLFAADFKIINNISPYQTFHNQNFQNHQQNINSKHSVGDTEQFCVEQHYVFHAFLTS